MQVMVEHPFIEMCLNQVPPLREFSKIRNLKQKILLLEE